MMCIVMICIVMSKFSVVPARRAGELRLRDVATLCRSKNAGVLALTFDVRLPDFASYQVAKRLLTVQRIASLYAVEERDLNVRYWESVRTIKITMPRVLPAGSPGDPDVYGCQQHALLLNIPWNNYEV
jgi:hypothetical protein